MAEVGVIRNRKVWLDQYNLSGQANAVSLEASAEEKDDTVFGKGYRIFAEGSLKVVRATVEGLLDEVANPTFGKLGASGTVFSIAIKDGAVGDAAYFFPPMESAIQYGGSVGDIAPFSAQAMGRGLLVRGAVLENATRTIDGNAVGVQLGAVGAGKSLYAALHFTAYSGFTNVVVTIQSDTTSGFAAPTTRITFATVTGITSELKAVAGPITDTWWRAVFDATGAGSGTLAVIAGIL